MNPSDRGRVGDYVATSTQNERVEAYLPPRLPTEQPVEIIPLLPLLEEANQALGRLEGVSSILPDPPLFIYMYVKKEALLSSQIEGTQSSLSDLLIYENADAGGAELDDVREVSNYVDALYYGLERLRGDFPLSLRLLREIHGILLNSGRGHTKAPGEFRTSQNWIGGTRPSTAVFVPPPPDQLMACLDDFEKFLHADIPGMPVLARAGIAHLQFESIHPFLDGNGRIGRLLITLMLCDAGILTEPLLYLSLFLKTHREIYYDLLQRVRTTGDWEAWLEFFFEGIRDTSNQAAETARLLIDLFAKDKIAIEGLGRPAASALRVHQALQIKPILSPTQAAKRTNVSYPTAASALERLTDLGILAGDPETKWGKIYSYDRYLAILSEGTEPL